MKVFSRAALLLLAGFMFTSPVFAGDETKTPRTEDGKTAVAASDGSKPDKTSTDAKANDAKPGGAASAVPNPNKPSTDAKATAAPPPASTTTPAATKASTDTTAAA